MKIALYCRVSTLLQFEKGNSIDEQKKRLAAYCESRGWENYEYFVDGGHSGSSMDRPALKTLLSKIKSFDMVLVYKLDRLSRNQRDVLFLIDYFKKNEVAFNSITENFDTSTPVGQLMLSMMGAFAELERQQINERMMMGRIASASKGHWRGGSGVPTGYKYISQKHGGDGNLSVDEDGAKRVKEVFKLFELGYSYHAISVKLGFATGDVVKKILSNPVYIGKMKYAGEVYDAHHEPIISEDLFNRVQSEIRQRDMELNMATNNYNHLLSGFLQCSCGSKACYHKSRAKRKDGTYKFYEYYECYTRSCHSKMRKSKKPCKNKVWRKDDLEQTIWEVLEDLDYEEVANQNDYSVAEMKRIEKELNKTEKQISKLVELYSLEDIPIDVLQTQLNALNFKKEQLGEELYTLTSKTHQMSEYEVREAISTIDKVRDSDLETQRAFIGQLIDTIYLLPDHDLKIKWKF